MGISFCFQNILQNLEDDPYNLSGLHNYIVSLFPLPPFT